MKTLKLIYGTAWKEELTESCVLSALKVGYRAVDTANQRKHYFEEGVGAALEQAYQSLGLKREEVFLQTKFTFARGQDHRKPYDENAAFRDQVIQSFESSLEHLKTDYLDSLLLHGPSTPVGLTDDDRETWQAMEDLCRDGKVRSIGISNVNAEQVAALFEMAAIKPAFVQNRCLALNRWDQDVREVCKNNGIAYQGFSLLTNNWKYLGGTILRPEDRNVPQLVFEETPEAQNTLHPEIQLIVEEKGKTIQQVVFRFAQQLGIIPLVGARSESNMKMNLDLGDFDLSQPQIELIENIAFR